MFWKHLSAAKFLLQCDTRNLVIINLYSNLIISFDNTRWNFHSFLLLLGWLKPCFIRILFLSKGLSPLPVVFFLWNHPLSLSQVNREERVPQCTVRNEQSTVHSKMTVVDGQWKSGLFTQAAAKREGALVAFALTTFTTFTTFTTCTCETFRREEDQTLKKYKGNNDMSSSLCKRWIALKLFNTFFRVSKKDTFVTHRQPLTRGWER